MKEKICTLMYHDVYQNSKSESGINSDSAQSYKVTSKQFERQIKACREYIDKNHLDETKLRLSFDDGGVSSISVIAPTLEKYGFKGYFFVATSYLNTNGFLTDNQVIELEDRGHVIGSHSHSHRQMMSSLSDEELFADWKKSLDYLSKLLKHSISIASLPNGYSSSAMLDVLKELGIKEVYTSSPTDVVKQRNCQQLYGRFGIKDGMDDNAVLRIAFNPFAKAVIKIRKTVLNGAKVILGGQYIRIREKMYKR